MKSAIKFFDGAFGTYYISKTKDYHPCEQANITNAELVLSIHQEYIRAGVNAIKTNTFSANRRNFKNKKELTEIITQGYLIAKQAALGTDIEVFADIGNISCDDVLPEDYLHTADTFIKLGAKNYLIETLAGFDEIIPTLAHIKSNVENAFVIVSFASSTDGYTMKGLPYKQLIHEAVANKHVDAVGLNCICGPSHLLSLVKDLGPLSKPLCVMPNAGYPTTVNKRLVYHENAEYFALKLSDLKNAGAAILGGCCGTTPSHIKNAIQLITAQITENIIVEEVQNKDIHPMEHSKKLKRKPISVELDPPPDCNVDFLLSAVDKLKLCGITTITLADSPLAKTRADSFMTSSFLLREKNIDVIPHLTCRDKNHIAIKGSLLGASFYGINKVLIVTGDPAVESERYRRPGVFNFNSKELIKYVKSLNSDVFSDNSFSIGGALNVNANNFDSELKRCKEKVDNGADFLYTQPLFSDQSIENFKKAKLNLNCQLYAGILPFVSYKNAVFLNNEVFGIEIPQSIVNRLEGKTPQEAQDISVEFCSGLIEKVYDCADGFYLMTPMKKIDLICKLVKRCFDD